MSTSLSHRGHVKWYSEDKGYGFVVGSDGTEVFLHLRALQQSGVTSLASGQPVEYELGMRQGKPHVSVIRPIADPVNPAAAERLTDIARAHSLARAALVQEWLAAEPSLVSSLLFRLVFLPTVLNEEALEELTDKLLTWATTNYK